ncbi:MAG: transketolase family protein [Candidatus Woesearchaeota archaeon]
MDKSTRDGYGDALLELGGKNKDVVVLSAGLSDSLRIEAFRDKFPTRYFEMGIAEQDMMGVAAGLSLTGKIPFVSSFGVFSVCRPYDQIRVSVAFMNANVKIAGSHTGIHVGEDGATAQALEDIALTRVLPNLTVIVPADYYEAKKAVLAAAKIKGPVYIRLGRNKTPMITQPKDEFVLGKAKVMKKGKDIAIIACGNLVYESLEAAKQLETQGIKARVINCHTIKPLDKETILKAARECKAIVTAEDHHKIGGLGSAVAELVSENHPVPIKMIGVDDVFAEGGKPEELYRKYGITSLHIQKAAKQLIKKTLYHVSQYTLSC